MKHLWNGPETAPALVLAPGDHGRLTDRAPTLLAEALARRGVGLLRFELEPDIPTTTEDEALLDQVLGDALAQYVAGRAQPLVIGGFSRGARVAAARCKALEARGLVLFSYPFHPRKDPNPGTRVTDLIEVGVPTLICQGTRDSLGNLQQVQGYKLPDSIQVRWHEDANHALHPRRRSGHTLQAQMDGAAERIAAFIRAL